MSAAKAKLAGYLCGECAKKEGGVWPKGHRATFHSEICPLCKQLKMLGCWDDWNWPDSRLGTEAKRSREI